MNDSITKMKKNSNGILAKNGEFAKEINEVIGFYEFYDSKPDYYKEVDSDIQYGQLWPLPEGLDYKPTREIRNHTKKLIEKQGRFMFGSPPTITLKPIDNQHKDAAESKRTLLDRIFDDTGFWANTSKAFIDSTIGKRVLLCAQAAPGVPLTFRYFKMPEFVYTVDPNDCERLMTVEIAYQDERTCGKLQQEERWHRWKYEMVNDACWCLYEIVDGFGNLAFQEQPKLDAEGNEIEGEVEQLPLRQFFNTGLTQLPCRVIYNGGLTGDTQGTSDIKDLIDLAYSYNRTTSDYRDALRFKMFEQPVFVDADSEHLSRVKIAPNAIIDLKTDPALGDGTGTSRSATVTTLASTFNFAAAADSYLDRLKKDMYEIMDQPLPEQLASVPSAKALKFMFYDLIARCEQKWIDWDGALRWVISIIEECCFAYNLYPELQGKSIMQTPTMVNITHNYPIPEDEELKRELAIKEVEASVMSHKTYIRKYGEVEDEQGEWDEILEEMEELNSTSAQDAMATIDQELAGMESTDGMKQVAGDDNDEESGEDAK